MTAKHKFVLHRFYRGMVREDMIALWASALRSGQYSQGTKFLHRPSYAPPLGRKINGAFDVLGVLCHVLDLPRKVETTHAGMLFAYADSKDGAARHDNLPDELLRFLVRPNRSKLAVDLGTIARDSPVLFGKIVLDTGLERRQLMLLDATLGGLNDLGVKFGTLSLLIESGHW